MQDQEIPSWAVAAAILVLEDIAMHSTNLTQAVLGSGLSNLGGRGGRTPEKTLRSDIATRHDDIFQGHGGRSGLYQIGNMAATLRSWDVKRALHRLIHMETEKFGLLLQNIVVNELDLSKKESKKSREDLLALEAKLRRIGRLHSSAQI